MTYNPTKIRPRRDFCLVLAAPRKEIVGSIILPVNETGIERVTEREGTIVAVGPGQKAEILTLKPGDRVVYRGFLKHANPVPTDNGEYFLMAVDDILMIIPPDSNVDIGCFSGRPQVPEKELK